MKNKTNLPFDCPAGFDPAVLRNGSHFDEGGPREVFIEGIEESTPSLVTSGPLPPLLRISGPPPAARCAGPASGSASASSVGLLMWCKILPHSKASITHVAVVETQDNWLRLPRLARQNVTDLKELFRSW